MLHLYDSGGTPGSTKYWNPRLLKLSACGQKIKEEEHLTDPWQIFMILSTPAGIQSTTIALVRSMRAIRMGTYGPGKEQSDHSNAGRTICGPNSIGDKMHSLLLR